jgi:hypothetical protein
MMLAVTVCPTVKPVNPVEVIAIVGSDPATDTVTIATFECLGSAPDALTTQ